MMTADYEQRREQIETYFDRTAADTWARLTSDEPVSGIRQTVREGRDEMRGNLLSWLPQDLQGRRILDAGCGTGAFAVEAAKRGADVVAVDLSATLVNLAAERVSLPANAGTIEFKVGDMRELELGAFDHVVAMDSLIHYSPTDGFETLKMLAESVSTSILFTFAPRTRLLAVMHAVGQIFPRGNRSPSIVPVAEATLLKSIETDSALSGWQVGRSARVNSGFYISHALEVVRQ